MIRERNNLATDTKLHFARWLVLDGGRDKSDGNSWAELLSWVYNKSVEDLAAEPLPLSVVNKELEKLLGQADSCHARSLTGENHSPQNKILGTRRSREV